MNLGMFGLDKYKEPSGICCDLCDDNEAMVNLFIFKHSFDLCSKCYNEIRNEFIRHGEVSDYCVEEK